MTATIYKLDDYRKTPRRELPHENVSMWDRIVQLDANVARRQREQAQAMFASWQIRIDDDVC